MPTASANSWIVPLLAIQALILPSGCGSSSGEAGGGSGGAPGSNQGASTGGAGGAVAGGTGPLVCGLECSGNWSCQGESNAVAQPGVDSCVIGRFVLKCDGSVSMVTPDPDPNVAESGTWTGSEASLSLSLSRTSATAIVTGVFDCTRIGDRGDGGAASQGATHYACSVSCTSGMSLTDLCSDLGTVSAAEARQRCQAMTCPSGMHAQGSPGLLQNACDYHACVDGYADCDGAPDNGCEADVANDPSHCGTCGHACPSLYCSAGTCKPP